MIIKGNMKVKERINVIYCLINIIGKMMKVKQ